MKAPESEQQGPISRNRPVAIDQQQQIQTRSTFTLLELTIPSVKNIFYKPESWGIFEKSGIIFYKPESWGLFEKIWQYFL